MDIKKYDYLLDDSRIAIRPPKKRGASKLIVVGRETGELKDSTYSDLDKFMQSGDLLVMNNTKVIKARLIAKTESGSEREILILEKHKNDLDNHNFKVMYKRKIHSGQILKVDDVEIKVKQLFDNGTAILSCDKNLYELSDEYGTVPLPPYLHRLADSDDIIRYQTVIAKNRGSVAAPTATLNMTDELLNKLKEKGVRIAELTLHVGLGTFMPIRGEKLDEHKMHQEFFEIPDETSRLITSTKIQGGRVIAAGTTVTRALEYSADKINNFSHSISGEADIFIYPGYEFKIIDGMLTNFHAPKSTVLMMAAAFCGWDNLMNAYTHALDNQYKFLSYGDSMLIL